jgi:ribose 5-phosphate isomerase B
MKVYLGADHRGFALKNKLKLWLEKNDFLHEDLGAYLEDNFDDYTQYAAKVASVVAADPKARGVLLCGSGVGVDVVANKFDNVRSAVGINPFQVEAARKDDNANILVIAADYTSERESEKMLERFLNTKYENSVKHDRRLEDIKKLEDNN